MSRHEANSTSLGTKLIQVTNIAPQATRDQMHTLFGFIGKIEEIRLYPTARDVTLPVQSRICYVKYFDPTCVGVALHLTNTVFIDRALIVTPYQSAAGDIPDEYRALDIAAQATVIPGLVTSEPKLPAHIVSRIEGTPPNQVITTFDPNLAANGLPPYPPLPIEYDARKIEEIRRTIVVTNVDPAVNEDELAELFQNAGNVKYLRRCTRETDASSVYILVEFSEQSSLISALKLNGYEFHGKPLLLSHSTVAIEKPMAKSNEAAQREIEEAMTRVKEAQNMISAAIDPVIGILSKDKKRSRSGSRSRKRSRSRSTRRRSRSKHRSRHRSHSRRRRSRSRGTTSRRRSRDRSKDRKRRRSPSRSRRKSRSRSRRRERSRRSSPARSKRRSRSRSKRRSRTPPRKRRSRSRKRSRTPKRSRRSPTPRKKRSRSKRSRSSSRRKTPPRKKTSSRSVSVRRSHSKSTRRSPSKTKVRSRTPERSKRSSGSRVRSPSRGKRVSRSPVRSVRLSRSISRDKRASRSQSDKRESRSPSRGKEMSRSASRDKEMSRSPSREKRMSRSPSRDKEMSRSLSRDKSPSTPSREVQSMSTSPIDRSRSGSRKTRSPSPSKDD